MYVIISALTRKLSSHRPNQPESFGRRRNPNSVEPFSLLLRWSYPSFTLCEAALHTLDQSIFSSGDEMTGVHKCGRFEHMKKSAPDQRCRRRAYNIFARREMRERLLAAAGSI
jgi:hypothetical protein